MFKNKRFKSLIINFIVICFCSTATYFLFDWDLLNGMEIMLISFISAWIGEVNQ